MNFETTTTKSRSKLDSLAEELEHGPIEKRSCTDKIFCILFIILVAYSSNYSYTAFKLKKTERLFMPVDHYGTKCGEGEAKDFKYLLLTGFNTEDSGTNIFKDSLCVEKCPQEEEFKYEKLNCYPNKSVME